MIGQDRAMLKNFNYWRCDCADNYFHSKKRKICPRCGAYAYDKAPADQRDLTRLIGSSLYASSPKPLNDNCFNDADCGDGSHKHFVEICQCACQVYISFKVNTFAARTKFDFPFCGEILGEPAVCPRCKKLYQLICHEVEVDEDHNVILSSLKNIVDGLSPKFLGEYA